MARLLNLSAIEVYALIIICIIMVLILGIINISKNNNIEKHVHLTKRYSRKIEHELLNVLNSEISFEDKVYAIYKYLLIIKKEFPNASEIHRLFDLDKSIQSLITDALIYFRIYLQKYPENNNGRYINEISYWSKYEIEPEWL